MEKTGLTVVLIPVIIVVIASLAAYLYFYISTGGFPPSLTFRLLGIDPAVMYLMLSIGFGLTVLFLVACGCVIYVAIEVYRLRKLMENPGRMEQ